MFDEQLGKLPGVTSLQLKPDTFPAVMPYRRLLVVIRLELKEKLNRLTRLGVIEPVMLAVVYGLEKFNYYTHGWKVNVFTDHKPLVSICQKPLAKAPKRLQNLLLPAKQYNFSIKY